MSSDFLSRIFSVICVLYGAVIIIQHMAAYEMHDGNRNNDSTGRSSAAAARYPLLFRRPFRKDRPCELRATDDGVATFPIPPIEQQSPVDRSVSHVFFFVPHAVDEAQLRAALDDLIRSHWTLLGARLLPEILTGPREVQGTLFFPLKLIVRLRSKIFAELEEKYSDDVVGRLGLSEGDVVSAVLCKLANMHRKQSSSRPVSLGVVVNLRGRIPELPRGGSSYVHNAIAYGFARLGKVHRSSSLAEMAYRHRLAVLHMSEMDAIEAGLDMIDDCVNHGNKTPILGDPGDRPYVVSNWTAAWKDLDFSAALAGDEPAAEMTDEKSSKPWSKNHSKTCLASPVDGGQQPKRLLVLGRAHTRDTPLRYVSMVMCKSSDGYWATFAATKKNTKKVEELLSKDPLLVTFL
ncbi:hypothetical protein RB597_007244 [Gaeumannomyces tritici]